ncbi:hypothetical protein Tco_0632403 [Tanacetum coccineum]
MRAQIQPEKMLQVRQDVKRPGGPAAPASIERLKARRDPGFRDPLNRGEDVFVPSSIHVIRIRIYNLITPIPDGPNNTIKNALKNLINTNIATLDFDSASRDVCYRKRREDYWGAFKQRGQLEDGRTTP